MSVAYPLTHKEQASPLSFSNPQGASNAKGARSKENKALSGPMDQPLPAQCPKEHKALGKEQEGGCGTVREAQRWQGQSGGVPMSYQGWSNYETWAVALWINNDQATQEQWARAAKSCSSASALAQLLKEEIDQGAPDLGASIYSDLLHASLGEVDWYEIAEHLLGGTEDRE